jgi:hypothetical protein
VKSVQDMRMQIWVHREIFMHKKTKEIPQRNNANLGFARDTMYSAAERRRRIRAIIAASSGNLVEWFDFYIYAFCAIYFAPAFFPRSTPTAQLLNTAGVFAAGFLMRPIGGWLVGRKR